MKERCRERVGICVVVVQNAQENCGKNVSRNDRKMKIKVECKVDGRDTVVLPRYERGSEVYLTPVAPEL